MGSVDFGGGGLTSAGSYDIFVAKFAPTGTYMWAKRWGGAAGEKALGLAVDRADNSVVLTGILGGTIDFGGGPLTSAGNGDAFLAKFSSTGAYVWAKRFGDASAQYGVAVSVDGMSDVVVTGRLAGTADFGGGPITASTTADTFVAKYLRDGTYVWAKKFTGSATNPYALATDTSGNIVLTGAFVSWIDLGGGLMAGDGSWDVFIAKFSPAGACLWQKQAGASYDDHGTGAAIDSAGNVFAVGDIAGAVDLGGGTLTNVGGPLSVDGYVVEFWP